MKKFIKETINYFVRVCSGFTLVVLVLIVCTFVAGGIDCEKVEQEHEKVVYVDGEITEHQNYKEFMGYRFNINFDIPDSIEFTK